LPDRSVEDEQGRIWLDDALDLLDLGDQIVLERVATRRVHDVDVGLARRLEPLAGDFDGILAVGIAVEVDLGALGHLLGLIVRAGAEGVRLNDGRSEPLRGEPPGHLCGGRRLPGPL